MAEAVVLLSGGLDSSTVLAIARERGFEITALTFDYGQKHRREVDGARRIAGHLKVKKHIVMPLDIGRYVSTALTTGSMEIPQGRTRNEMSSGIPSTYVPSRNTVFLSIAASIAESAGAEAVFIAANSVDFSGYPDCTPEFLEAFQKVLDVGTKAGKEGRGIRIEAPILLMSKSQIIREAVRLGVPLELTWSCYRGGAKACGRCDSCLLRLEGFSKAGIDDPLEYEVRR
ncbi:MAG: 7-cyano-7-deazaguanine synthase QueC [Candidatus Thermoplasmatota archaeon]|nr:7-cyano-7-deazaguanine synthase QueC [Candidatus Thermoplasmatota archaeon]